MIRINDLLNFKDEEEGIIKTYPQCFESCWLSQLKVASLAKSYTQKKEQIKKGKAAHSGFSHK